MAFFPATTCFSAVFPLADDDTGSDTSQDVRKLDTLETPSGSVLSFSFRIMVLTIYEAMTWEKEGVAEL